jgi:hypothetical protein
MGDLNGCLEPLVHIVVFMYFVGIFWPVLGERQSALAGTHAPGAERTGVVDGAQAGVRLGAKTAWA